MFFPIFALLMLGLCFVAFLKGVLEGEREAISAVIVICIMMLAIYCAFLRSIVDPKILLLIFFSITIPVGILFLFVNIKEFIKFKKDKKKDEEYYDK